MRCAEVMELMQRNLDGDLLSDEFGQLEDHLMTCSECRELNEQLKQLSFDLEALPEINPPYSLVDSILPQISADSNIARLPFSGGSKRRKRLYLALGSSAAAVLVAALIWPGNQPKMQDYSKQGQGISGVSQQVEDTKQPIGQLALNNEKGKNNDPTAAKADASRSNSPGSVQEEEKISPPDLSIRKETQPRLKQEQSVDSLPQAVAITKPDNVAKDSNVINNTENISPTMESKLAVSQGQGPVVAMTPEVQPRTHEPMALAPTMQPKLQSSPVSGVEQPNTLRASNEPTSQIQLKQDNYPSPDGKDIATIDKQSIVVRNVNGALVFQGHRFEQTDQVHLFWVDNQQLVYDLYRTGGIEHWRINLMNGQEHKE